MTPPHRPASRRPLRRLAIIAALVAVAVAAFGAAIAGSTPDKPYSAFISAPQSDTAVTTTVSTSVGGAPSVGIRLRNDTNQQSLGSANITLPTNLTIQDGSLNLVRPAGGTATLQGGVIALRNLDLPPGAEAFVTFAAVVPCTASGAVYRFDTRVKQSNDFNGTGNDLNAATPPLVLSGVGSCVPCTGNQKCSANTSANTFLASVTGVVGATGGRARVSFDPSDAPAVDCTGYDESTGVVEFDVSNGSGTKTVQLQITNPTKLTSLYKVCFKAQNAPAVVLPVCTYPTGGGSKATPNNMPCALAPESKRGVVTLTAITPAGDPWIKG